MINAVPPSSFLDYANLTCPIDLLLIDDSAADAELIFSFLRRAGLPIIPHHVDSPESFQQHLVNRACDVILSDHNLKTWTAKDALDIVHHSGMDIPFIVVTGTLGDERAVGYLKSGAADYVLKEHLERLPAVIQHALREKQQRDENRRLHDRIRDTKEEWERTFDAIPDSIMLLDSDRRIRRANAATNALLGMANSEIIGKQCFSLLHECGCPPPDCPFEPTLATGKEQESEIAEFGARRILRVSTVPLRNHRGEVDGAVHVMRDITERKQLQQSMLQAQKLEAIGRLAGGVAHDFNNILGVIQGYSDLMQDRIPESDEVLRQQAREIHKAAQRAAGVTRQLLAFSRKQVMQLRPIKLNEVVIDLAKMIRTLIGENIQVEIKPGDDLGIIKADPVQLQQVLLNLAINARDAMPNGGRLTISTNNVELDDQYPRIHDPVVPGRYVMLAVSDTGVGMDEETRSHVFEPFFTTKDKDKGTGFGLSIVYGIVKQSGGYIWVYSEPGRGTTFKIYLPAIQEKSNVVPISADAPPVARRKESATVLLVEDEDVLAEMITKVLQAAGYSVLYAPSGEKALDIARTYEGEIHVMLSDVILRGTLDGLEVANQLSGIRPATKVLFMSGYSDALNRAGTRTEISLLEKPFTNDELRYRIHALLQPPAGEEFRPQGRRLSRSRDSQ